MADIAIPVGIEPGGGPKSTYSAVAAEALSRGMVIAIDSNGQAGLANAKTTQADGFVLADTPAGKEAPISYAGRVVGLEGLTPGARIWLSENDGRATQAFNGGLIANGDLSEGSFPVQVAIALTATTAIIAIQRNQVALEAAP
jgi:hypothetical protein